MKFRTFNHLVEGHKIFGPSYTFYSALLYTQHQIISRRQANFLLPTQNIRTLLILRRLFLLWINLRRQNSIWPRALQQSTRVGVRSFNIPLTIFPCTIEDSCQCCMSHGVAASNLDIFRREPKKYKRRSCIFTCF